MFATVLYFIARRIGGAFRWIFANPVAGLCVLLILAGGYEWNRARGLETKLTAMTASRDAAVKRADLADADVERAVAANASQVKAIAALQASLNDATALTAEAKAAGARALARLKVSEAARRAAQTRETEARSAIYANDPTCAAWGALPVCPAIAGRLRAADTPGPDQ